MDADTENRLQRENKTDLINKCYFFLFYGHIYILYNNLLIFMYMNSLVRKTNLLKMFLNSGKCSWKCDFYI